MLLALDAGNSNITIGAFDGAKLVADWRLRTVHEQTADEWGILLHNLFGPAGLDIETVDGMIISSVVPPIDSTLAFMAKRYFHTQPIFVGARTNLGLTIKYDNPYEVGADRLVNAVAAYERIGGACVIVDFGTAITYDVVSEEGEYVGGIIGPGVEISMEALTSRAAAIPRIDLTPPRTLIGKSTVEAIRSGIIYGFAAQVDGMLTRLRDELGDDVEAIATGGLAGAIVPFCEMLDDVDPLLTLKGLRIIWARNQT